MYEFCEHLFFQYSLLSCSYYFLKTLVFLCHIYRRNVTVDHFGVDEVGSKRSGIKPIKPYTAVLIFPGILREDCWMFYEFAAGL